MNADTNANESDESEDDDVDHNESEQSDDNSVSDGGDYVSVDRFEYHPEWDAPVVGAIPTVEMHRTHRAFVEAAAPDAVVVPFVRARQCVKRGDSAADWLPESVDREGVTVITTMTVSDDDLARISWQREVDVIEAFDPDYHVPADYPVYGDDPVDQRVENCMQCAVGTEWVSDRLPDDVGIIPLIKGTTPDERAICERQAAHLGADMVAVYGGQYFGAGGGGGRKRLVEDLQAINVETGSMPTLVIGSLSPWVLKETPPNVVAGAGLRAWREAVEPRSSTPEDMRRRFDELSAEVVEALGIVPDPTADDPATDPDTVDTTGGM